MKQDQLETEQDQRFQFGTMKTDHKILFLIRSLDYGGAERQLVALAKGLHARGLRVIVAVFYANGSLEGELHEANVPVILLKKSGRWDMGGFLWRLAKLLRKEKPTVVHGYLPVPNLLTILFKPFFPRIRMIWGVRASNMDLDHYDWFVRATFRLSCIFARFADLIIVNSRAGLDFHARRGYPREKMVVISNGIDSERFRPDKAAGCSVRQKWGIAESEKLIGLVARLDPMKDHLTFLKAAAILAKERLNVRFVCVGDGPELYKSQLHALAKQLGLNDLLTWAGSRMDITAVYNAFDIISSSSSYGEGFPNVIAEAMACGVPCVGTDVGDSAIIVGDTGVIVTPDDPYALFSAWRDMLSLEPIRFHSLASAARSRIISRFSLDHLINISKDVLCGNYSITSGISRNNL